MRPLTLVLPHFMNLGMLAEQQRVWADYPPELRGALHVIVVDDCSPKGLRPSPRSITVDGLASFRIYRCLEKVRWNWLFARNLGVHHATTDWVLLTDIDHVVPAETLTRLMAGPLNATHAYRFARVDAPHPWPYRLADCPPYKPHNDTWLLTRPLFNYDDGKKFVCGYDEALAGCYGTSGEFKDRVFAVADAHVQMTEVVIRYPREVIADASTPKDFYTRKNDPRNDRDLQRRKNKRAPDWRPQRLTFPYELVAELPTRQEVVA